MNGRGRPVRATVTMDYVLLGYLRTWAVLNHLRVQSHPTDHDVYALVIGPNHPVFPEQQLPWEEE